MGPVLTRAGAAPGRLALEQAASALQAGDAARAEQVLRQHLLSAPDDADALVRLAQLLDEEQRSDEATLAWRRAAAARPIPAIQIALIDHLGRHVGPEAALAELRALGPALRDTPEALMREATFLDALNRQPESIPIYRRIIAMKPEWPAFSAALGTALVTVGETDQAIAAVRSAIKSRRTYGEGYWTLANFKTFRFSDRDIAAMRRALNSESNDRDRAHLHFALGKALEDRKKFAKSFEHYDAGNAIKLRSFRPGLSVAPAVDSAIAAFDADAAARAREGGSVHGDPIFIVGLNRSGSTLIEQILASHSSVEATMELTVIPAMWQRLVRTAARTGTSAWEHLLSLDREALAALGDEYLERTRAFRRSGRPRFVDKLPANWLHAAFIRLILPNAKIVDARRHPMACGFSNFKMIYGRGMSYAYSQQTIGRYYQDYWRFMRHMAEVDPGTIHRVINERLVENPQAEVRALLDYLGLPFEQACLEHHKTRRAVATPSAEQVRQPINRSGVDQWKNYEQWLGPLKQALGPALEGWEG